MLRRMTLCLAISILLLAACSAQPTEAPTPEPTTSMPPTQQPSSQPVAPRQTVAPAATMEPIQVLADTPTPTRGPTETPEATLIAEPTVTTTVTATLTETATVTATVAPTPTPQPPIAVKPPSINPLAPEPSEAVVATSALTVLPDAAPAPPLTVIVSMNREFAGYHFKISGLVRNDSSDAYAGLDMNATFFRADGSRFGPVQVNVQCPILEPGESCPFLLDTVDKGITQVMLHPDGYPTDRHTVPVDLSNVSVSRDAIGYVHIAGTVHNPNPVTVRDVTITGTLIDQSGKIVNTGVDLLLDPIAAGDSTSFEVVISPAAYSQYKLYVQALPYQG